MSLKYPRGVLRLIIHSCPDNEVMDSNIPNQKFLKTFQNHHQPFEMTDFRVLAGLSVKKYVRHVKRSFVEAVP